MRVDVSGRDEVARVGRAFNSMVERLAVNLDELRAARDRLVQPTEAMSEGFAIWDAADRLVLYNSKLREFFRPLGDHLALGVHVEDLSRTVYQHLLARGPRPGAVRDLARGPARASAHAARAVGDASARRPLARGERVRHTRRRHDRHLQRHHRGQAAAAGPGAGRAASARHHGCGDRRHRHGGRRRHGRVRQPCRGADLRLQRRRAGRSRDRRAAGRPRGCATASGARGGARSTSPRCLATLCSRWSGGAPMARAFQSSSR